jgi:2',3'-cyclic-nucleotide 2'-phosphodiesterase (5'-nucleotidase family)
LNESNFPWLAANIQPLDKAVQANIWPYVVRPVKGKRVLIYGLLTQDTLVASKVDNAYSIENPVAFAKVDLPKVIQQEHPDVVILLTHMTIAEDRQLANDLVKVGVPVHAIFGGHDHHQLFQVVQGVPIIKLDSDARTLGRFQLNLKPATPTNVTPSMMGWLPKRKPTYTPAAVAEYHYKVFPITAAVPVDATFEQALNVSVGSLYAGLNQVVGHSAIPLDVHTFTVRSHEAPVGNLVADALRSELGTQVSLINGGSLRAEQTFPAGKLTKRDILTMMPFANKVTLIHGNGALLRSVLEWSVSRRAEDSVWGGFLQVSGLKVQYDLTQPVGKRVASLMWSHTGKAIEPTEAVFFNISTYLAEGGNAFSMLPAFSAKCPSSTSQTNQTDADIVAAWLLKQRTPVAPKVEGRIRL